MKIPRITKIAGLGLIGFCAAAAVADKVNLTPVASQTAGFIGALLGTLVGGKRARPRSQKAPGSDRAAPQ